MTYALPSFRLLVFPKTLDNQFDTCESAQLCRLNAARKLVDFYDKRFISRSNQINRITRLKNVMFLQ